MWVSLPQPHRRSIPKFKITLRQISPRMLYWTFKERGSDCVLFEDMSFEMKYEGPAIQRLYYVVVIILMILNDWSEPDTPMSGADLVQIVERSS